MKLWRTLEGIPGLAAIRAYWEYQCGVDYLIVQPFLRATDLTGATYPCREQCIPGCYRDIVDYGDGEVVAVCQYPWFQRADIPLTKPDTVLQQLDIATFTKAIARSLGFRWQTPAEREHGIWGIGFLGNGYGIEQPVILLVHSEQERFRSALHWLLGESLGRFALLVPTSRYKDLYVHEALTRHEIRFHSLEEHIGLDDDGRLVAIQPIGGGQSDTISVTPVAERAARVNSFLAKYALTIKEIVGMLGLDYRDFKRWRKGELPDNSVKLKKIESFLHLGPGATKRIR